MIFPDICCSLNVINKKSLSVTYIICSGILTSNLDIFKTCIMWFSSLFGLCVISVGLDWSGICWVVLAGLDWTGLCWSGLGCVLLDWIVLDFAALDFAELCWVELDWIGFFWAKLCWDVSGWNGLC